MAQWELSLVPVCTGTTGEGVNPGHTGHHLALFGLVWPSIRKITAGLEIERHDVLV